MTAQDRVIAKQDELIKALDEQALSLKNQIEKLKDVNRTQAELIANLEDMVALLKTSNDTLAYAIPLREQN